MTSYWTGDGCGSGSTTGSGLKTKDFQVNEKGWYTYKGRVVVATATPYLLKHGFPKRDGITYRKYYDTLTIVVNGVEYPAIVLDSCGAAMSRNIIDVFVSSAKHSITTNITVK